MGTPLRVLIIEHSEDDMMVLMDNIQCYGYSVTYKRVETTQDMSAALDQQEWDVVICDDVLPSFSVSAALTLLQNKGLDLPFIIVSSTVQEEIAVDAMRVGAHDFIHKNRLARLVPAIERERRNVETRRKHKQVEAALRESGERESDLKQAKAELEIQVAQRTAELTQANKLLQHELKERLQKEAAHRETEGRLRAILENASAIIHLKDLEGRYILINRQFENLFLLNKEQVLGKTDYDIFPKEVADTYRANDYQVIVTGTSWEFEEIALHKNNGIRTYISIKFPLKDDTGVIYGLCGISTDISDRVLVEEALRKANERSANILESITDAFIALDNQWRFTYANREVTRLSKKHPEELLGKTLWEISPWSVGTIIEQEYRRAVQEQVAVHFEVFYEPLSIWLEIHAYPSADGLAIYYQDITERKLSEEERAKLIAILEATPDIVATADINQQTCYLNNAARKIFGLSEDEDASHFTIPDAYPDWADKIVCNEGIPAAMRDGVWVGETAFLSHDGREIPTSQLIIAHKSPDGSVKQISIVAREITQQKQIAATLLEAERRWRSLLENVRLGVVGVDRNGKVEYVNSFFLKLVGYTKAEVIGKDWLDTFLPQQVQKSFSEVLEHNFQPYYQNSIQTKSGEERMIAWNSTVLKNLHGEEIGTMSIGEDITERNAIERMKNEFISVVSHELRTPLTSIHGALNLLSSGLVDAQSQRGQRVIEIAAESTERLVRLVNDILDLESLESCKISLSKQVCNAADLMMKATDIMQVMANRAGITLSVSQETITLNADPDRIIQVLTNLLDNAIKFSPSGSTVWLTVERGTRDWGQGKGDTITTLPNSLILFQVRDQGRGIPAKKIESIFERFHQVDTSDSRKKGGTGLGLTICRNIVQQHSGRIWAESTLGEGSSFYFTLPGKTVEDKNDDNQTSLGG